MLQQPLCTALSKVQKENKPALSTFLISFPILFPLSCQWSRAHVMLLTHFPLTKPAHLSLQHAHPDGQLSSISHSTTPSKCVHPSLSAGLLVKG